MANETLIQLGSSGNLSVLENGNFYLAFNDNYYSDNSGSFIFNLYKDDQLIKSSQIMGSYDSWQPIIKLEAGANYTYIASGSINHDGVYSFSPGGWVGKKGTDVMNEFGGRSTTYGFSASWPNSPYIVQAGTITNPYEESAVLTINEGDRRAIDSSLVLGIGQRQIVVPSRAESNYFVIESYTVSGLIGGYETISYAITNYNGGYGGGSFRATFRPWPQKSFIAPDLWAYSLVGKFVGLSSPTMCFTIGGSTSNGSGTATGSGYDPGPPYNPGPSYTTNQNANSGKLYISIDNTGSCCSEGVTNKIVEFSINSYYPNSGDLNLDFNFIEKNASYAKYLAFTQDANYTLKYTGYILNSGTYPVTIVTGYYPIYENLSGLVPKYITGIDSGVQTCYELQATGSGIAGSGTGILEKYYYEARTGVTGNGSGYIEYTTYYFQSGTGVVTEIISGFDPQMFVYKDNQLIAYNDDWLNSFYVTQIRDLTTGQSITLPFVEAANIFNIIGGSGFSVNVSKSPKYINDNFVRKNSTTVKLIEDAGYKYTNLISPMASWASYDVTSGMNSKNVIAYALEIVNDLYLNGQSVLNTGTIRNVPPILTTGRGDIRSEYIGYCFTSKDKECKEKEMNDAVVCYTGEVGTSGYNKFVSGVLEKFKNSAITEYDPEGTVSISSGIVPSYFQLWSGSITYNSFVSGDKILFNLYPFDYTGLYQQYFNTNPPHQSTGLVLTYGNDFSDITSLTNQINNKLSGVNYPVWYPYDCISGSGNAGIYVSGAGLIGARIRELPTGDINYNNIIDFYSLRNNTGFVLNLNLSSREIGQTNIENNQKLKYLLPSYISLQGSNDNSSWTNLDIRSGIDWTSIEPISKEMTGLASGLPDDIILVPIPDAEEEDEIFIEENGVGGGYQNLYNFIQSGAIRTPGCAPQYFSREVSITKPTGFPPGTVFDPKTCAPTGKEKEDGEKEDKEDNSEKSGISDDNIYNVNYLRTGWVLNSGFVGPITGVNYNYYRVYLSGFESNNIDYDTSVNTFIVKNINLYSSLVNEIPVHTGDKFCAIGSNYSVNVQGNVMVPLAGELIQYINASESGVFEINNQPALMDISGYNIGDYIKFNKVYGKLVSNSGSGFITDSITGTGCFTTGITDWFYDPITKIVSFEKDFSGCISGSGRISGEYIRLKESVVNQQLSQGGFFRSNFYVSIVTGTTFTGLAPVEVLMQNLTGLYTFTGVTGGYATLGYFELNTGVSINLNSSPVDYIAGGATGYNNATAYLNYGQPEDFDWLAINGQSITYNSDSGNWIAPYFFSTSGQLLNIINADPVSFLVSGSVQGGLIKLDSLISGSNGNSILIVSNRGNDNTGLFTPNFYSHSLTGGQNLYRQLYGTGNYTGLLSVLFYHTGQYSTTGATGIITGYIPTYQGIRDFTGIWDMSTGNFFTGYNNFLQSNLLDNNGNYFNIIGGSGFATSPLNIDVGLFYRDLFDTQLNEDVVKLTFSGSGVSGISKTITGIFQLGT